MKFLYIGEIKYQRSGTAIVFGSNCY